MNKSLQLGLNRTEVLTPKSFCNLGRSDNLPPFLIIRQFRAAEPGWGLAAIAAGPALLINIPPLSIPNISANAVTRLLAFYETALGRHEDGAAALMLFRRMHGEAG